MDREYIEKYNYTYRYDYKFMGWGIDCKPIYAKYETKFNIAKGLVYFEKFLNYVTDDGQEYNSYIR